MRVAPRIKLLRRARFGFLWLNLAIFLALSGLLAWGTYDGYQLERAHSEETARRLARALDKYMHQTFRSIDAILAAAVAQFDQLAVGASVDDARWDLQALLRRAGAEIIEARNVVVIGADGRMRLAARPVDVRSNEPVPILDASDADYFRFHRENPRAGLFIGSPHLGKVSGEWYIPITRRIAGPTGEFAGVLMAMIDPWHFRAFYLSLQIGAQGSVGLYRDDGILLARAPDSPLLLGKSFADGQIFAKDLLHAPEGVFRTVAPTDGVERVVAYRKVPDFPLVVIVGIATQDALGQWYATLHRNLLLWLLLLIGFGAISTFQIRQAHRRWRVEAALIASERQARAATARLNGAIASINVGFYLFDADDRLVTLNSVARQSLGPVAHLAVPGIKFDEFIHRRYEAEIPEERIGERFYWIERRLACHRQPQGARLVRNAGERWLHFSERLTSDGGVVIIESDITALKKVHEELRAAKEAAELASRTKTAFLANMSHELRTPLNSILGFSEALKEGTFGRLGNPQHEEYVGYIHQSGAHLLQIINDILDLSKIEAGKMELHREPIDGADLIERAVRLLRHRAEGGGVRVLAQSDKQVPPIDGDETKVKQILFNLISNAIKFTERGGEVTVTARAASIGLVELVVRDTGIGMTSAELAIAMTPFGQIDSALARHHKGTGLGLPLVKHIAELHGGSLHLESEKGKGTTVTVRLPQWTETQTPAAGGVSPDQDGSSRLKRAF